MNLLCDCCQEPKLLAHCKSGEARAMLCNDCATGGHAIDRCLICGARTWHCGRVAHFSDAHRSLLFKLSNDPFPELSKPSPLRKIGSLSLPDHT